MAGRIFYFVPESRDVPAGGILTLINHVSALNALGCEAYALSESPLEFSWSNLPFPQRLVADIAPNLTAQDVVVVPEGTPTFRQRHLCVPEVRC